jgi:hypothetical protein
MREKILLLGAAAALASCNQAANDGGGDAAANVAPAKPKQSSYCFFKDEETKGWKASVDKSGNVTVTGKAHVKDARYTAGLGQAEVTGTRAELRPTIAPNTGYASPDNWWDVSFTIPNSGAVENVAVHCGSKTLAQLTVKRAGQEAKD